MRLMMFIAVLIVTFGTFGLLPSNLLIAGVSYPLIAAIAATAGMAFVIANN